jgi:hypothetical protein
MDFREIGWNGVDCIDEAGSCEHGIEPSGSIRCSKILKWLSNRWLLKKGSASWCQFIRETADRHLSFLHAYLRYIRSILHIHLKSQRIVSETWCMLQAQSDNSYCKVFLASQNIRSKTNAVIMSHKKHMKSVFSFPA